MFDTLTALNFDIIIFVGIVFLVTSLFFIEFISSPNRPYYNSRYKNFWVGIRALVIIVLFLFVYGSFIEPRMITVKNEKLDLCEVHSACSGRNIKVVFVADWHVGPYKKSDYVQKVVTKINELQPSMVIMAGDYIYSRAGEAKQLHPLSQIHAPQGVYASLGNHDFDKEEQGIGRYSEKKAYKSDYITETLESFHVNVLRNEMIQIKRDVTIIGQEDWYARPQKKANSFDNELFEKDEDDLVIFIQHNPDGAFEQALSSRIDLVLSGHTHGGQIRLPFIGSVPPLPTNLGKKVDQGWFDLPETKKNIQEYTSPDGKSAVEKEFPGLRKLYITRGLGETGPRARLFAWPQIVVFDIDY